MDIQEGVMKVDVIFLVDRDALDQQRLQPLSVVDRLQHILHCETDPTTDKEWSLNFMRSDGHLYLPFFLSLSNLQLSMPERSYRSFTDHSIIPLQPSSMSFSESRSSEAI